MDLNSPYSLNSTSESQSSVQQIQQESSSYRKQGVNDNINRNLSEGKMQSNNCQDNVKRKKSKLRNSTIPPNPNSHYPKELDAWLENCMKDINAPQLSSSSEFLDYNTSSFTSNKNTLPQSQNFNKTFQAHNNKFNQGFPKLFHNEINSSNNSFDVNKFFRNLDHIQNDGPGEFASLPPIVNFGPNNGDNSTDNLDSNDPSRSFRFSDPCLIGTSDNESAKVNEQHKNLSENRTTNGTNDTNKFLATLLEQINILHETNSKICRNLHETKVEMEALKHNTSWGLRHRRDSLSGLSTHSQPMGFAFGNQSPAPTYHSGVYTPGMMTDVVREVKEAARVREEALLNRVKAMVEERSWSFGEGNLRVIRDVEDMKSQIQHLRSDRKEANKRITQLEAENKYLKSILISMLNNKNVDIMSENENSRSRKNFPTTDSAMIIGRQQPKRNEINHNHGPLSSSVATTSINQGELFQQNFPANNERNQISKNTGINLNQSSLNYNRKNTSLTDSLSSHSQNGSARTTIELFPVVVPTVSPETERNSSENGTVCGGIVMDGGGGGGGGIQQHDNEDRIMQIEKDTLDLRRELQEAIASKKHAENRVIALENMVKNLQIQVAHTTTGDCNNFQTQSTNNNIVVTNGSIQSAKSNGGGGGGSGSNNMRIMMMNDETNLAQYTSQMQKPPKLSLSGPITDL